MKIAAALLVATLAGMAHAQAPKKDNPACKDPNPVFAKFPNAFTIRCDKSTFARLDILQAKDPAQADGVYTKVPKEGEYWEFSEQIVPAAGKSNPSGTTHGVPRDRMTPDGVGPLAPVAANDAEAGRAKNRRVEMVLR